MAKTNIVHDTFEQLAELGQSTAKKTVKAVTQTVNPLYSPEKNAQDQQKQLEELNKKKDNHTRVDFEKLQKKYASEDAQKTTQLRNRLFQLVKDAEKQSLEKQHQKEQKKQYESQQEVEKEKKLEEERIQAESFETPKGKVRKSILGGGKKKSAGMEQHAEYKPSSSKN